jgi:tagatose-1,6-bisphosphate aldolase
VPGGPLTGRLGPADPVRQTRSGTAHQPGRQDVNTDDSVDLGRLGTVRRLARLATDDGFFCVAALDHPENYLALFDRDVTRVAYETVVASKLELATGLSRHASALLLDPVWSLGQAIATGTLPGAVGVLAPIELLRYTPQQPPGWDVHTRLRPGWTPEKMAKLGVDGVKLVLFYRADLADAAEQRRLVADLVAACRRHQLPVVVEPIWYPVGGEDPTDPAVSRRRAEAIVAAAAEFALLGADILKVQFPGSTGTAQQRAAAADAARELDAALTVPWVLLSEGAGYDDFAVQMEIGARAGASGYIAGRAVWGDAVGYLPETQREPALARAAERLAALNEIVRGCGRPWTERVPVGTVAAAMPPDWYESYGE